MDWTYYVTMYSIMQSHLWWNILQHATIQWSTHHAIDRPAMWLMLPGILPCRPMEGSTTLINWRLQRWMPWYPILTGTCAFGRVANLEFRLLRSFWMKKTSQFFRLDEKNLQPNAVVLPSQIDLLSLNLVDTQVVFTGYNARSMVPYCGVANGRGLLSMLGELVF